MYLPVFLCLLGLFVYLFPVPPKVQELAIKTYFAGLLISLYEFASKIIPLHL